MTVDWDARQRAMLAEMGFRLPRRAAPAGGADTVGGGVAVEERPAPAPAMIVRPRVAVPTSAPTAAFVDLDFSALREAVLVCRGCSLCEQRRNAVYGNGAVPQAQWLVVTDPPDEADDAAGEALSGDAGRLLDRMLAAAGHSRRSHHSRTVDHVPTAYVTPIVKCRAPRGRAPLAAELDACEAVLARQAALLQPRLVLALGPLAARRLTGLAEPLGKLRGRVHTWHDLPVVVSYHPAYLLRSPADKAGAWDDLCLARANSTE